MASPLRTLAAALGLVARTDDAVEERVGNRAILATTLAANSDDGIIHASDTAAQPTSQATSVQPPVTTGSEFGASGTQVYGGYIRQEDYNPELDDFVKAVGIFDKMRKGDAQINAMLSVLKLPLRGAKWKCQAQEDGDLVDKQIADFCNAAIFEDDAMESSWDYVLRHILLQLDHGFSVFEVVWTVDESGSYRIKRLAPRLSRTIRRWHVDRTGRLKAVDQYAPVPIATERPASESSIYNARREGSLAAARSYNTHTRFEWLTIPADYLCVFTLNKEGDNYEGISVLRTIYRNWFYKDQAYNLEGVRLDRFGVGIPVANLDASHTLGQTDLDNLTDVLKKVRANERAFLIAPPGVKYSLLPETGSKTAGTGATNWINHHDQQIARNVLAGFLTLGNDPHGTLGFGSRLTDMFISSLNGIAAGICADIKAQIVKKLCFMPDTRVTMSDGTRKAISDVHIGDYVLGHDGQSHAVIDVMARPYGGPMKSINVTGHDRIVCTPEHPFFASTARPLWMQRRRYAEYGSCAVIERARSAPEWVEASDLTRGEYLVAPIVCPDDQVQAPSAVVARLMGAFIAEGCYVKRGGRRVGVQFTLGMADVGRGYLDQIVEDLVALGYKPTVTRSTRSRAINVRVSTATELVETLEPCGEYSHSKRLPQDVARWPAESKRHILGSYWTGDGCFFDGTGYPQAFMVSRSRDLAEAMVVLLESINISCRMIRKTAREQSKESWSVAVSGRHARDLKTFIASGVLPEQSRELHDKTFCVDGHHHYRIKDIVDVEYHGLVYNLEVENVHTYIANGVVVHNCDINFDMTKRSYPRVVCQDLEQVDMANLVEALATLANTWVQPDDDIEKMLRGVLGLPPLQAEMKRATQKQAAAGTAAEAERQAPGGAVSGPGGDPGGQPQTQPKGGGLPTTGAKTDAPVEITGPAITSASTTNERLMTLQALRKLRDDRQRVLFRDLHAPVDTARDDEE